MRRVFRAALIGAFLCAGPALAAEPGQSGEDAQAAAQKRAAEQRVAKQLSRECIVDLMVESCTALGRKLELGQGLDVNYEAAAELYVMTCDNGDPEGCLHLAALVQEGRGAPLDPARAEALFEKACAAGVERACARSEAGQAR